jgi:16S rRNA (guanine(966)-N(2))-methyltransferase RsmD
MLRLTGGRFRGRLIQVPPSRGSKETRPSKSQLRQALFNSIQMVIPGARVLDLFSGSGSLAFEALSRGAQQAVAVESSRPAMAVIHANAKTLGVEPEEFRAIQRSVDQCWDDALRDGPFDVVLADPPYADEWELRLLNEAPWEKLLNSDGVFVLEWGVVKSKMESLPDETPFLVKVREKLYGDSGLTTYRRK